MISKDTKGLSATENKPKTQESPPRRTNNFCPGSSQYVVLSSQNSNASRIFYRTPSPKIKEGLKRIKVRNIPANVRAQTIMQTFDQFGYIQTFELYGNVFCSQYGSQDAVIGYLLPEMAHNAKARMNGEEYAGKILKVSYQQSKKLNSQKLIYEFEKPVVRRRSSEIDSDQESQSESLRSDLSAVVSVEFSSIQPLIDFRREIIIEAMNVPREDNGNYSEGSGPSGNSSPWFRLNSP